MYFDSENNRISRQCIIFYDVFSMCHTAIQRGANVASFKAGFDPWAVFRYISGREVRRPFGDLKLAIWNFSWVRNVLVDIFGKKEFAGTFLELNKNVLLPTLKE